MTRKIITLDELLEMDEAAIRLAKLGGAILPVAGGSPEGDDDDDKNTDDDKDKSSSGSDDEDDDKDKDRSKKGGKGDDEDEYVRLPKSEAERLRRENNEAKRKDRDREKKRKDEEEKAKAEKGKWEELASDREKERDEAVRERDDARNDLKSFQRRLRITEIAKRLNYVDAEDAHLYLKESEMDDDDLTERALKRVLREKKHLKADARSSGSPMGGGANGGGLTIEQIQAMSMEEQIVRKDEVDKALEAMGRSSA